MPEARAEHEYQSHDSHHPESRLKQFAEIAQVVIAAGTIGLLAINIGIIGAMQSQIGEMQQQNKLIRQQLVGSQAAIVSFPIPEWDEGTQKLKIVIINSGLVNARSISFDGRIQRFSLPEKTPLGPPVIVQFSTPVIGHNQNYQWPNTLPWPLPEVPLTSWPGKQYVTIEGRLSYNNGFDDVLTQSICYLWTAHWHFLDPPGWSNGGWSGDYGCNVEQAVTEFRLRKKDTEQRKQAQKQ